LVHVAAVCIAKPIALYRGGVLSTGDMVQDHLAQLVSERPIQCPRSSGCLPTSLVVAVRAGPHIRCPALSKVSFVAGRAHSSKK
jgi:hypothetical protein